MFQKLKKNFVLNSMLMTSLILLMAVAVLFAITCNYYRSEAIQNMTMAMEEMETCLDDSGVPNLEKIHHTFSSRHTGSMILLVTDVKGNVSYSSVGVKIEDTATVTRAVRFVAGTKNDVGTIPQYNYRFMRQSIKNGYFMVLVDQTEENNNLYFQLAMYVLFACLGIGMLRLMAYYMSNRFMRPVTKAVEDQARFLADASHELKTPLTVILANMDIALSDEEATIGQRRKWLENTKVEAGGMALLINDMLDLSRTDGEDASQRMQLQKANFSDLVDDCILTIEAVAFERHVQLNYDIQPDLYTVMDGNKIRQAVMILLDNAMKYVDENGTIKITVKGNDRSVILTVFNTGEPIPESKKRDIFERFFRAEDSREKTEQQGGFGLGLSIAKNIISAHNGRIYLDYSDEAGTCFAINLPGTKNVSETGDTE